MQEFFSKLFSSSNFMPHGHCYLWRPDILWLHVISDAIITLAYFSIPFAIVYLVKKRKDLAFNWVFIMFSIFIFACGATHFMGIWTVWEPLYRLDGFIKGITALASIATAFALWPLLPKALAMPSASQLEEANRGLHLEIVERRRAEKLLEDKNIALREAEKLKSDFIANVSHELRTPLTLILSPLETLLNQRQRTLGNSSSLAEKDTQLIGLAHNNAIRLLHMINGLLDFSKIEAKKTEVNREILDISQLLSRIAVDFGPVMKARDIEFSTDVELAQPLVEMDAFIFERILFNLLSNASKFTPAHGRVDVAIKQLEKDRITLEVQDTGVGISTEDRPHLFQKFRQLEGSASRRFEGTGLGLALVKEFSELLGGRVSVQSKLGQGSTFTVDLFAPVSKKVPDLKQALIAPRPHMLYPVPPPANENAFGEKKVGNPGLEQSLDQEQEKEPKGDLPLVLIAEDNADLANYIAATLSEICTTRLAKDGNEALREAKRLRPQLVMSDVMMPNMDGYTLCRALKSDEETLDIPVLMLTALTHREALLKGWEVGADEYLFKPFHPTELLTRVRSLLKNIEMRQKAEKRREEVAIAKAETAVAQAHVENLEAAAAELRRLNRVKDEFLATVSHELRTPMVAILGWSELLAAGELGSEEYGEAFHTIFRNAQSQVRIIDDILDISRMMNGHFAIELDAVDLEDVVRAAVSTVQNTAVAKNIAFVLKLDRVRAVLGDPDRLKQVIWNLLSNAIKFSPKGQQIEVLLSQDHREAHLLIKDHGIGITPEFLPYVFERFLQEDQSSTRRQGGLGLGLSIVQHITELHGGRVEAMSEGRNRGSTFALHLPLKKVEGEPS